MCNFYKKKKKLKKGLEKKSSPAHHFLLPSKVSSFSVSSHSLTLSSTHHPAVPSPFVCSPDVEKQSGFINCCSVCLKLCYKKCIIAKTELAAFFRVFFFLCFFFFLLRMKNSHVEVCIIGAVHHNDNNDSSERCQSAELMRLMRVRYWTSDLYIAQQAQITG